MSTGTITKDRAGTACRHHWVIESPNGEMSAGVCKRCGATKAFRNSYEDWVWDAENFTLNGSRARRLRERSIER